MATSGQLLTLVADISTALRLILWNHGPQGRVLWSLRAKNQSQSIYETDAQKQKIEAFVLYIRFQRWAISVGLSNTQRESASWREESTALIATFDTVHEVLRHLEEAVTAKPSTAPPQLKSSDYDHSLWAANCTSHLQQLNRLCPQERQRQSTMTLKLALIVFALGVDKIISENLDPDLTVALKIVRSNEHEQSVQPPSSPQAQISIDYACDFVLSTWSPSHHTFDRQHQEHSVQSSYQLLHGPAPAECRRKIVLPPLRVWAQDWFSP